MDANSPNALAADLDEILDHSSTVWEALSGSHIFITGGTGFIGTWLVESLVWSRRTLGLEFGITILTRDPAAFLWKVPHLRNERQLRFLTGDVRTFAYPGDKFSHVIHSATAASAALNLEHPFEMIDTIIGGSKRVFEFAGLCGAKTVLNLSSGGIYGAQPPDLDFISEEYLGAPDPVDPFAAYSEAKRLAEMMGCIASRKYGFEHKIARISALVGPHLPLDIHYAMGNFIRDAIRGSDVAIKGDGTPVRSYLYIGDLIAWLLVIMSIGESNRPYNAGSEIGISLKEAAVLVARVHGGGSKVSVANGVIADGRPNRYVLSTKRARVELGLDQWTDLETAVRRTFDWHKSISFGQNR